MIIISACGGSNPPLPFSRFLRYNGFTKNRNAHSGKQKKKNGIIKGGTIP
jgi:hypothetical protein